MRAKLASLWLVVLVVLAAACGDTGSTVGNEDVIVPDNNVADQTGDTGQDTTQGCVDQDKDGAMGQTATCPAGTDCNDLATGIHPGAQEVCGNNVDEDCNGSDLACASPCEDKDGDQAQGKTASCPQGTDCDDANNTIHPGATEVCGNNVDEDCNGSDLACPPECPDADKDGYIVKNASCPQGTDCDDGDNDVHPNAVDVCENDIDEDCDGKDAECLPECDDADGDGYGNGPDCKGYDCNDGNKDVHPGAEEVCDNGLDDDCVDGDADCPPTCEDHDGDGFGSGGSCPVEDCNDDNTAIYPGAEEVCGNGVDEDCSGTDLTCTCEDNDGDGYGQGDECLGPDCNDFDPWVYPGAVEVCGNGLDDDCAGGDEVCPTLCDDWDNDGYGEGGGCLDEDCDDFDPDIHPDAYDVCENGIDENCDGKDDTCPIESCIDDYDCGFDEICDQGTGACRSAKVWEWWAPTFYVDTDTAGALLDLPRAVNFDGNYSSSDNQTHLTTGSTAGKIYYSMVKTSTHWYLGYYMFFPKRWSKWLGTTYENTMRAVLLVVEQNGSTYGKLVAMDTMTEDTFYQYQPTGGGLSGSDGDVNWDLFFPTDHHPLVYVHSQTHSAYGDSDWFAGIGLWDVDGFPGGDGVVYRFGAVADSPVNDNDDVYYELLTVKDELWGKRMEIGPGQLFDEFGHFAGSGTPYYKSLAPWRLYDENWLTWPEGEVLYDPADLVRRHFSSGWGTFSYTYTYNPYAIKVTIHDLMIYVTMDPFSGYADPYINLYLYDGAGTETLVLAMSGGLQNNWKKSDVAPNTLLYLDAEMGRNYFYGLLYPGDYYFGIQIRDSDGILDDWIMDNAKTDYQKFEGKKLVSWGKSDSYISVELPQ